MLRPISAKFKSNTTVLKKKKTRLPTTTYPAQGRTTGLLNVENQESNSIENDNMVTSRIGESIYDPYIPVTSQSNQPLLGQGNFVLDIINEKEIEKGLRDSIDIN